MGATFLQPAQAAAFTLRVNAGAGAVIDSMGQKWSGDRYYLGRGGIQHASGQQIARTNDDVVFQTNRWGMTGYDIPLPKPGSYRVRLLFAETVFSAAGSRVFDVMAEGRVIADDLDVFARVGYSTAYVQTYNVSTKDRTINLRFGRVADDPIISGIEVIQNTTSTTTTAATTTTTKPARTTTTTAAPFPTTTTAPINTTTTRPTTTTTTSPVTPTTTAAPSSTTTTVPPPPPSGVATFPNATTTGVPAGTTLQASGSIVTSFDGQIIDAMEVSGSIQVRHNNVTIKRTRIRQPGGQAINISGNFGLVVEDCEIDGSGNPDGASVIAEHNYVMRRCNVHHFGEGPRVNGNVTLEDNYFHDFVSYVSMGAHQDTVQITSGSNIVIRHNTMLMNVDGANGGIYTCCYAGNNLLIENNLLAGGLWATTGGGDINGRPLYTNVIIRNNRISTMYYPGGGYFGPMAYKTHDAVYGNVWHESGQPI